MNDAALTVPRTLEIVVDDVFPHAPDAIWRALTSGDLIGRWLMAPTGFAARVGQRFTFQTTPGGAWDGVIHCEVTEVVERERLAYTWRSGHPGNRGYGAPLDTHVTWTLSAVDGGTRLRLVHAGFDAERNATAFEAMNGGWSKAVRLAGTIAGELYTGGCACGAIRFQIAGEPVFQNECHCRDCQRQSGTGHGSYLSFPRVGVTQTGTAARYDIVADSGHVKTRAFCPTCGSPVFITWSHMPDVFTVHAASLDDPARYRPQAVTYAVRAWPWDRVDEALPKFERMPPA